MNERNRNGVRLGLTLAALGILLTAGFVVAASSPPTTAQGTLRTAPAGATGPWFPTPIRHVVTILLENEESFQVLGVGPYETALAQKYTYLPNYFGVSHPSEPNYLALTGGSVFGRAGNDSYTSINNASIADLVELRGETWGEFAQSMPVPCDINDSYPYAVRHNPFVFYTDIVSNTSRCDAHVTNFGAWTNDVANGTIPNYAFITPNVQNDGHDTSASYADAWLETFLQPLLAKPWAASTLFAIVYDEGNTNEGYSVGNTTLFGGNVYAVLVSPYTLHGGMYAPLVSHYNLLTTTEWLLGVGSLGNNDSVTSFPPMVGAFHFPPTHATAVGGPTREAAVRRA